MSDDEIESEAEEEVNKVMDELLGDAFRGAAAVPTGPVGSVLVRVLPCV